MVESIVNIVFGIFGDVFVRRHVSPTLLSKHLHALALTLRSRAHVHYARYTMLVTYATGLYKKCGQSVWALLTVQF